VVAVIAYGACVGSWEKLRRNVVPQVQDRALLALSGQTSIAVAYNTILDAYTERDVDAVILLHDDLEITDPDAEAKFLTAIASGAGLAGVAGGGARAGLAWWNEHPVGHQRTDVMNIDFGTRTGEVELLEGSVLVFSPQAVKTLRFDTRFPGFHGYDEIAMAARAQMLPVAVVDVDTHHHTPMGYKSLDSHAQWVAADRLFREKWGIR
jgi:hypothetical protein